jgi:hypothetical protein
MEATHASEEAEIGPLTAVNLVCPFVSVASLGRLRRNIRTKKTSSKSQCFGIEARFRPHIMADVAPPVGVKMMKKSVCLQKLIYWADARKKFMKGRKKAPKDGEGTGRTFHKATSSASPHKTLFQSERFGNNRISQTCRSTRGCAATTKGKTFFCLNPNHLYVEGLEGYKTIGSCEPFKPFDVDYARERSLRTPTIVRNVETNNGDVGGLTSVDGPDLPSEDDPEQKSTSSTSNATIIEEEDDERPRTVLLRIRRTYDKRSPYEVTSTNVKRGMRF